MYILNILSQTFIILFMTYERAVNQEQHIFVKSLTAACESDSKPLQSGLHSQT